jgi:very-short-patch-repair endonuclease
VTELLARANGHRGRAALAAATAREPKLTRSDWEVRMLALIRAAALPNSWSTTLSLAQDHGHAEVDFYGPKHRLLVETHSWRARGLRNRPRPRRRAPSHGYRVVRFTWRTADATIRKRLRALLHH